jgi:predicted homoserine dehydrogenase-like protein
LTRDIARGTAIGYGDVRLDETALSVRLRRQQDAQVGGGN